MTAPADTADVSAVASPSAGPSSRPGADSILTTAVATTNSNLARLSKTVVATSAALTGSSYGDITSSHHYRSIMNEMAPSIRRPDIQRRIFSFNQGGARISRNSASIVGRAAPNLLLSKEMLADLPESKHGYSLLQGFKATLPEPSAEEGQNKNKLVRSSRSKAKEHVQETESEVNGIQRLEKDKADVIRKLRRIDIRKSTVIEGIREIDARIELLNAIKLRNLERLSKFEDQELELEDKLQLLDYRIELLHEDEDVPSPEPDRDEEGSEDLSNNSGQADTESISLLALGDSLLHYGEVGSYHSDGESNERREYSHVSLQDASDSDTDEEDNESFAREMTASMREAWVSSFLEWEKLTGE
ncbi:hypothetical protein V1525DRAFT_397055 [Lipomyces kononenkoae]|uniref:Uncharacterized protein n=1 Tax=Lipomyces kononenkoae TaxID=34357 RepID=A0ACC3T7G9_LIPKO